MSNPFHTGGDSGGGMSQMMLPLLMMAAMPHTPAAPPPLQSPTGTPSTNKPSQTQSFVSGAAPVPAQSERAPKSLLGA